MNKIYGILLAGFIFISSIYIYEDHKSYQIKPCDPPVYEIITISTKEFINDSLPAIQPDYTDQERELLARAVMSEGSLLPMHGKIAIVATIMNRVRSDKFPDTIPGVLYQENQFSLADNGDPTQECYDAIDNYVKSGWPSDMLYFRNSKPHSFGYEYLHIGNTYFNTENNFY